MAALAEMKCTACRAGENPLEVSQIEKYHEDIPEWSLSNEDGVEKLRRTYKFEDFNHALDFTNEVGKLAEEEGHHPIIQTEWGGVTVTWWTHKIDGLHKNDFLMAAKCDEVYKEGKNE